jgi:hypothetical protein
VPIRELINNIAKGTARGPACSRASPPADARVTTSCITNLEAGVIASDADLATRLTPRHRKVALREVVDANELPVPPVPALSVDQRGIFPATSEGCTSFFVDVISRRRSEVLAAQASRCRRHQPPTP